MDQKQSDVAVADGASPPPPALFRQTSDPRLSFHEDDMPTVAAIVRQQDHTSHLVPPPPPALKRLISLKRTIGQAKSTAGVPQFDVGLGIYRSTPSPSELLQHLQQLEINIEQHLKRSTQAAEKSDSDAAPEAATAADNSATDTSTAISAIPPEELLKLWKQSLEQIQKLKIEIEEAKLAAPPPPVLVRQVSAEDSIASVLNALFSSPDDAEEDSKSAPAASSDVKSGDSGDTKSAIPEPETVPEGGFRCGICFDVYPDRTKLCNLPCAETQNCNGTFCHQCFNDYIASQVNDYYLTVPPIKCPACATFTPIACWKQFVAADIENKYRVYAESLLKMRCVMCDETVSLLPPLIEDPNAIVEKSAELVNRVKKAHPGKGHAFRIACRQYNRYQMTADDFIKVVHEVFPLNVPEVKADDPSDETPFLQARAIAMNEDIRLLASMIADTERRTAFMLRHLRKFLIVPTACCSHPMCFVCQFENYHYNQTCREASDSYTFEVKYCPSCSCPIVRSDGCDHIVCLCGDEFCWNCGTDSGECCC